ncbi:MAG: KEOPS complex subunit Pcc1 [Candidatus Thalassarchaeum sp.]
MSGIEAEIVWCGSEQRARSLLAAISPDDPASFQAEISGEGDSAELKITVTGKKLETVRSTVDDLLACLAAAESSLDISDS